MNSEKYLDRIGGAEGTNGVVLVRVEERWVNPATVSQIAPNGDGARIHLTSGQPFDVDMTPADVAGQIAGQHPEAPSRYQFDRDPDAWMQGGQEPAEWNRPRSSDDPSVTAWMDR